MRNSKHDECCAGQSEGFGRALVPSAVVPDSLRVRAFAHLLLTCARAPTSGVCTALS